MTTTTHPSAVERLAAVVAASVAATAAFMDGTDLPMLIADAQLIADIEDGTELRLLDAAAGKARVLFFVTRATENEFTARYGDGGLRMSERFYGPTVAAAAKACREALEGAK